jgi:hypothetical protein
MKIGVGYVTLRRLTELLTARGSILLLGKNSDFSLLLTCNWGGYLLFQVPIAPVLISEHKSSISRK